jgi:hypothetical protein
MMRQKRTWQDFAVLSGVTFAAFSLYMLNLWLANDAIITTMILGLWISCILVAFTGAWVAAPQDRVTSALPLSEVSQVLAGYMARKAKCTAPSLPEDRPASLAEAAADAAAVDAHLRQSQPEAWNPEPMPDTLEAPEKGWNV